MTTKKIRKNATYIEADFNKEPVIYHGREYNEADATKLAQQILQRVRSRGGRPSLTGTTAHSPQVSTRVTPTVKEGLIERAAREGKSVSDVVREAIDAYI